MGISSPGSSRSISGLIRLGLRKKACLRAPSALSCFMRLSLDRRFWNQTWTRPETHKPTDIYTRVTSTHGRAVKAGGAILIARQYPSWREMEVVDEVRGPAARSRRRGCVNKYVSKQTNKQKNIYIYPRCGLFKSGCSAVHTRPRVIRRHIYFGTCTESASNPRCCGEERAQLASRRRAARPASLKLL